MERVPIRDNPKLFDALFARMQETLHNELPWLDYAFGKAERLVKMIGGRRHYTPNIYVGGNEYREITPDSNVGNYSFFVLREPQDINQQGRGLNGKIKAPFSLIFWFDMRTIEDDDVRGVEDVKQQILHVLQRTYLRNGRFHVSKIYERAENIFREYTLDETDNQYLMHPFAGLRFDGEADCELPCEL